MLRKKALALVKKIADILNPPPVVVETLRKGEKSKFRLHLRGVVRATMTNKEGMPAIFLGIVSVVITVAVYFVSKPNVTNVRLAIIAVTSFAFVLVTSFLSAWWALRNMPPSDYARTMIGGRSTSEILQVISYEICDACGRSLQYVTSFEERAANPPGVRAKNFSDALAMLAKRFAEQDGSILRISAMLELAADELNIPLRRVRDLLFNYDPGVHRAYAARYVHNAESLRELSRRADVAKLSESESEKENEKSKWYNLKAENDDINKIAKFTIEAATRLINYAALHPKVLHLAAVHSTCQATKEYARAVRFVAKETTEAAERHRNCSIDLFRDGIAALHFLARKQRTHSGFDLNQICLQACYADFSKKQILQRLSEEERRRGSTPFALDLNNPNNFNEIRQQMISLTNIDSVVKKEIEDQRNIVVNGFKAFYKSWSSSIPGPDAKLLLVTHGFSTTVREVLKRGIVNHDSTDIFIIGSGRNGALDSKLMRNSLVVETADSQKFRNVTVGDEQSVLSFLDGATHVMFILGAECFDGNGRALHPRGLRMEGLRTKLAKKGVRVIVVAEGFKCYPDILSIPWSYRYHLDRIQFYRPEWIDHFITSETRYEPRRKEIKRREDSDYERRSGERRNVNTFITSSFVIRSRHHGLTQPNLPIGFSSQPIQSP